MSNFLWLQVHGRGRVCVFNEPQNLWKAGSFEVRVTADGYQVTDGAWEWESHGHEGGPWGVRWPDAVRVYRLPLCVWVGGDLKGLSMVRKGVNRSHPHWEGLWWEKGRFWPKGEADDARVMQLPVKYSYNGTTLAIDVGCPGSEGLPRWTDRMQTVTLRSFDGCWAVGNTISTPHAMRYPPHMVSWEGVKVVKLPDTLEDVTWEDDRSWPVAVRIAASEVQLREERREAFAKYKEVSLINPRQPLFYAPFDPNRPKKPPGGGKRTPSLCSSMRGRPSPAQYLALPRIPTPPMPQFTEVSLRPYTAREAKLLALCLPSQKFCPTLPVPEPPFVSTDKLLKSDITVRLRPRYFHDK